MPAAEKKYVQTPLLRVACEIRAGMRIDEPPVDLLHGWPDDVRTWDRVADGLTSHGFTTIAPWLRGYGATRFLDAKTMRSGQVVALAQDVIDLLDALGIERATIVGHDWGARAAYALAALFPKRIVRIVACASGSETGVSPAGPSPGWATLSRERTPARSSRRCANLRLFRWSKLTKT